MRGSSHSKKKRKGSHKNVFDRDECTSSSSESHKHKSRGKGKGKGYNEKQSYGSSTQESLDSVDSYDSYDRSGGSDVVTTPSPTAGSVVINLDGGKSSHDLSSNDSKFSVGAFVGETSSSASFSGSTIYFGLLIGVTVLAVVGAIIIIRRGRDEHESSRLTPEERKIALMKGLTDWSSKD